MSLLPGQPSGSGIFGDLFNVGVGILKDALAPKTSPQSTGGIPVDSKMPVWAWVLIGVGVVLLFGKKLFK